MASDRRQQVCQGLGLFVILLTAGCGGASKSDPPPTSNHAQVVQRANKICSDFSAFVTSAGQGSGTNQVAVFEGWAKAEDTATAQLRKLRVPQSDRAAFDRLVAASATMSSDMHAVARALKAGRQTEYQRASGHWQQHNKLFEAAAVELRLASCHMSP